MSFGPPQGSNTLQFEQAREILIVRMLKKGDQEQQATEEEPADPSKKKSKQKDSPSSKYTLDGDEFSEQESEAGDDGVGGAVATRRHIEAELDAYLRYKVTKQDEVILEQSLLFWWKSKSAKIEGWPLIAQVARDVLCEPASSAKSECNFSDAGNTITKKRNQLQPDKVDDLMFLRSTLMCSSNTHKFS
jgi:hypothetical protein